MMSRTKRGYLWKYAALTDTEGEKKKKKERNEQKMIPTAYRDIGKKYLSANNVAPIIYK